jgi:drug/metabolite transporter superfamily protein YnfA
MYKIIIFIVSALCIIAGATVKLQTQDSNISTVLFTLGLIGFVFLGICFAKKILRKNKI